ncbi:MAG: hypothetical protein QXG38_02870 [Candidatus Hadarchaeales archaeon]
MRIISSVGKATNVRKALEKVTEEINGILRRIPGRIAKMDASVDVGVTGATCRITVTVDEKEFANKYIVWANEPGKDENAALVNAQSKINQLIKDVKGEVAGFYVKSISPPLLPRTYTTIILGINENLKEKRDFSAEERRELLSTAIHMLGGDPSAVNITQVAKAFEVSRDTIYEDLKKLGFKR